MDELVTYAALSGVLFGYSLIIVFVLCSLEERVNKRIEEKINKLQEQITRMAALRYMHWLRRSLEELDK